MRGINDAESPSLLAWALDRGYELRFIEQMPLDADHGWTRRNMITAAEIRALLSADYVLSPDPRARDGAPAERFEVRRGGWVRGLRVCAGRAGPVLGTVGIIASVTEPFCSDCRRTRITAEGKIMSCLFSREEFDLLGLLREGASDEALAERWQDAMWVKPKAHGMDHVGSRRPGLRPAGPQHERHRRLNFLNVRYFAAARAAAGVEEERFDLPTGATVASLAAGVLAVDRAEPPAGTPPLAAHPVPQQLPAQRGGRPGPRHCVDSGRRGRRVAAVRRRVSNSSGYPHSR